MDSKVTDLEAEVALLKKRIANNTAQYELNLEKALHEKNQIVSLIYDTVDDIIFALEVKSDGEYFFTSVNQSFLDSTGLTHDKIIGKNVKDIIPEPSLSLVLKNYKRAIREKKIIKWEETTEYPTGTKIGSVTIAPIFDAENRCSILIGSVHDITELTNNALKLEESLRSIERKNSDLQQYAYITSHDLLEPLNTIIGFTELLLDETNNTKDKEAAAKYASYISNASNRLRLLIRSMLVYNSLGRNKQRATVDGQKIIKEVLQDLDKVIKETQTEFEIDDFPVVQLTEGHFRSLIQNLISNAIKYRHPDRPLQISIKVEQRNNKYLFSIKDNGIGIDIKYSERIFQLFQRLQTRKDVDGTGIGLSLCKKIVEIHNGSIWVDSKLGQGSTFFFTLPEPKA